MRTGITKSVRHVVTRELAVLSTTGMCPRRRSCVDDGETQRSRYDMDFSGSAYSTSAFIRDVALSLTKPRPDDSLERTKQD